MKGEKIPMIIEKAYAKVNLFLNVLDKRKDGYHNLEMLNVKIDLFDTLEFKLIDCPETVIIKSNDLFLSNQENVVIQVARYMCRTYDIKSGLEIKIDKRIPFGAGLGGNSADSAAVIKGINKLFELNLSQKEMQEIGIMYGADIPYCLTDKAAIVTGIGEVIEEIDLDFSNYHLMLINPREYISTKEVFEKADKEKLEVFDFNEVRKFINENDIDSLKEKLFNSLECIVEKNFSVISRFKQTLVNELGDKGLVMTGSGSSFIKLIDKKKDFSRFINAFKGKYLIKINDIL